MFDWNKYKVSNRFEGEGVRQSLVTLSGNVASAFFSAVAMMIISRQLGPEKFGYFSVGFALVLILPRFSDLGLTYALQQAIPKLTNKATINRLFSLSVQYKLFSTAIIIILGTAMSVYLSEYLEVPTWVVLLAVFLHPATVIFEQLAAMYQSLHLFTQAVLSNLIQSLFKFVSALALLIYQVQNPLPYFVMYLFAPLVSVVGYSWFMPRWVGIHLQNGARSDRNKLVTMAKHAAVWYMASGFIENIDVILVKGMLSSYETGLLAGANRIAMLFTLVAFSFATVLNSRVSKYVHKSDISTFITKAWMLSGATLIGLAMTLLVSKWLLLMTVGPLYIESLRALNYLIASSFFTIATVPFVAVLFAIPKLESFFSISGIAQVIVLVFLILLLVPQAGFEGAALARLYMKGMMYVASVAVAHYGIWRIHTLHA